MLEKEINNKFAGKKFDLLLAIPIFLNQSDDAFRFPRAVKQDELLLELKNLPIFVVSRRSYLAFFTLF